MLHEWAQAALRAAAEGGPMVFVALAFATLLSEDLTCIAAGLLVTQGALSFAPATLACYVGILSGDMLLVLIGRTLGRSSLQMAPLRWWARPALVERAEQWFERRGPVVIFASRFTPGTRVPAYFAAGALRAPLLKFAGWFALACAIWTPLLIGATVLFGEAALRAFASWASVAPALLVAGAAAWLAAKAIVNLGTWRGRRLALSRWRRLTRWQFWPEWLAHAPVIFYASWLGLRYRTFAPIRPTPNPGGLRETETTPGETDAPASAEYRVFYLRRHGEDIGQIVAISTRRELSVTGDGTRTLENLILADDGTLLHADFLLKQLGPRLDEVPAEGERVGLTSPAGVRRGVSWIDASALRTTAVEAAIAAADANLTGLRFGEIEVHAETADAFQRGAFSRVEPAEFSWAPAHVLANARSLRSVWRALRHHWREAFEVHAATRANEG